MERAMGLDVTVDRAAPLAFVPLLAKLAERGLPATIAMVDGQLHLPKAEPPATWRDVRLRTPAGMLTVRRDGARLSIVVFGNADDALQRAQQLLAELVRDG
jgi:hypothetical protein